MTIDNRVLEIAEAAWAMISERNSATSDTGFETFVYEQTTEFLIALDQDFKSQQADKHSARLSTNQGDTMSHDGHTIDVGPVKVLCVECRSDLDVRPCTEDNRMLCERCHVDEFGHSCEFEIELKGRKCIINQHPDPDELEADYD